uniref:Gag-pol protein n=1 Tax=Solanum tuberosum TaxID=4113 RepID=M1DWW1_SOLTU
MLQRRRVELQSKALHKPARILVTHTPPPCPVQEVEQVPPVPSVQAPLPRSLNRVKVVGLRTILEEKLLSTDGVVDRYPEMWHTIKFNKFEILTRPRGSYIPSWYREFYAGYGELVPNEKKKANSFAPVDHLVVQGRRVKCSRTDINEVLGCTTNVIHVLVDQIQKKTLDDLKGWLAPLISDITPRWIKLGFHREKRDLNVDAWFWFGFISRDGHEGQAESDLTPIPSVDHIAVLACLSAISGEDGRGSDSHFLYKHPEERNQVNQSSAATTTSTSAAASRPPIDKAMLFKTGHLAQSANVHASQDMTTRRANAKRTEGDNQEVPPQPVIDPLEDNVTNLEFRLAFQVLAQAMTAQANRGVVNLVNPNVGMVAARVRDFTGMNPLEFYGSKVEEDPQEFIDEVYKILVIIGVTQVEKMELVAYQLNGVAQIWFNQ